MKPVTPFEIIERLKLELAALVTKKQRLMQLMTEAWSLACNHDGIETTVVAAVFSDSNPHAEEISRLWAEMFDTQRKIKMTQADISAYRDLSDEYVGSRQVTSYQIGK